jgi:hypothetical protein
MTGKFNSSDAGAVATYLLAKVRHGTTASEVAQFVVTSCFEIDKALTPIVGQHGLEGMLKRSVHLASARHPWLAAGVEGFDLKADLTEFRITLSSQGPEMAARGGGLFLEQFHQLLTSLVGPSLTERLLRSVWATFLSGPSAQESLQ